MGDQIVPEGLNEWQQIESPFLMSDDCSEFPPLDHDVANFSSLSSLEMSSGDEGEEAQEEEEVEVEEERRLTQRLGVFRWEIIQAACKLKNHLLSSITGLKTKNGIAFLMSTAASGTLVLVLVSLFYMKVQRQRKAELQTTQKFMILNLIEQKDQVRNYICFLSQFHLMNPIYFLHIKKIKK